MNKAERDALREKHFKRTPTFAKPDEFYCGHCGDWYEKVYDFGMTEWPCDVIKVLDAWETPSFECDHERVYMGDNGLPRHPLSGAYFNYCPTCGVKV